ncbi:MAG TPA: hypothetical protein VFF37_12605, partial [Streptomyces sp.]|nr:hypothetical protein [Streptomyces sp.]
MTCEPRWREDAGREGPAPAAPPPGAESGMPLRPDTARGIAPENPPATREAPGTDEGDSHQAPHAPAPADSREAPSTAASQRPAQSTPLRPGGPPNEPALDAS